MDTAKGKHLSSVIETPGGQGVHREVESEGFEEKYRAVIEGATPLMNRSAKGGAKVEPALLRRRRFLIHPPHQGVCGRHGTEDLDVTPGGLVLVPGWRRDKRPYKPQGEVGSEAGRVVGQPHST